MYTRFFFLFFFFSCLFTSSSNSLEIIIGGDGVGASAAFISPTGETIEITGLPTSGFLQSVDMNLSGVSIVGGRDFSLGPFGYAAFISPEGVVTPIDLMGLSSQIEAVSINDSSDAIIGGRTPSNFPFAARVSSLGVVTPITLPSASGDIDLVSINDFGNSLIGGALSTSTYAALVSSTGTLTVLTTPVLGSIESLAISNTGNSIMGGQIAPFTNYAVLVSSGGVITPISGLPGTSGYTISVGINDSGYGVIGGQVGTDPYLGLVSPEGVATSITGLPSTLIIEKVGINSFSNGIVGGRDGFFAYAAFFYKGQGSVTPITGLPEGEITSVAINDTGAALIGGEDSTALEPYAALISPSGIVTPILDLPSTFFFIGAVDSVSMNGDEILAGITPNSFGPGSGFANSLFALSSQILPNHLSSTNLFSNPRNDYQRGNNQELSLVADASSVISMQMKNHINGVHSCEEEFFSCENSCLPCEKRPNYTVWFSPFGAYGHQAARGGTPSFDNWIGGGLLGFDYTGIDGIVLGGGFAYAYNYADISGGSHARTNQELLVFYTSFIKNHFCLHAALWGGVYQMKNTRKSLGFITTKADIDGGLLSPHIEISTPFYGKEDWFLVDPFVMFDMAGNWQGEVEERGLNGFNLLIDSQYTFLMRSELGVRLFEKFPYSWGTFVLKEKVSWVNKLPLNAGNVSTSFVASPSTFSLLLFSNRVQNLAAVQLSTQFYPKNPKYPYGSITYQGEFGSPFQGHFLFFEIGKSF